MSKYIKKEVGGQIIFIAAIILAIVIGLLWNALEDSSAQKWEPVGSYPIANAHISWEQSFHSGPWGENDGGT